MSTRERILTIRLLERITSHPAYAQALGIEEGAVQPRADRPVDCPSAGRTPNGHR